MATTPHPTPDGEQDDEVTVVRDRDSLLQMLDAIDVEGWDGPTGTALLHYVRGRIVRPLAIGVGLRGAVASQAEATAWQGLWVELCKPSLREATSPWGVLGQVARRQLLGEIVAARFATSDRRGWKLEIAARGGVVGPAVSLDLLLEVGWEPTADDTDPDDPPDTVELATAAARALTNIGWSEAQAAQILMTVAEWPDVRTDGRTQFPGWRSMATTMGIPPWQARRLTIALRGTADWPGLLARIAAEGPQVNNSPAMRAALLATRRRSDRSPVLAAKRAEYDSLEARPQHRAS